MFSGRAMVTRPKKSEQNGQILATAPAVERVSRQVTKKPRRDKPFGSYLVVTNYFELV